MANQSFFILNPISGGKSNDDRRNKIEAYIQSQDSCTLVRSEYKGHAYELARENSTKYKNIIAVGGDGTANEVAHGILNTDAKLGIIPLGSGNGLAHHLGVSDNWEETIAFIKKGKTRKIDIIYANEIPIINVGGIGFDGHISKLFDSSSNRGLASYMKLILKEVVSYKEFKYKLRSNEVNLQGSAFIMAFANATEFGNEVKIAPNAIHNDGKFNLITIRKPPFWAIPSVLLKAYAGKIDQSKYYQEHLLESAEIDCDLTVLHRDGEVDSNSDVTSLSIRIVPNAMDVYY
ncbi:MAG: diacylglycerol kinase family protein [Bacteroidota bacterium]